MPANGTYKYFTSRRVNPREHHLLPSLWKWSFFFDTPRALTFQIQGEGGHSCVSLGKPHWQWSKKSIHLQWSIIHERVEDLISQRGHGRAWNRGMCTSLFVQPQAPCPKSGYISFPQIRESWILDHKFFGSLHQKAHPLSRLRSGSAVVSVS